MRRGGRERQLASIFKYSRVAEIESKILIFNKVDNDYLSEYAISDNDIFYLDSKNTVKRFKGIKKVFKNFKPDIIYAWGSFEFSFCFFLKHTTKAKIINGSIRHGIVLFNKKQVSRLLFLHMSKYIIANSKAGLIANKLTHGYVLYNGIDKKFSEPTSNEDKARLIKSVFGEYNGEAVFVSVANLVPYKDYFTILQALKKIRDKGFRFSYMAIGEGPLREKLEDEINLLGLEKSVKLVGRKSNVEEYLGAGDIFIHSSKGEGCSNAILEAMAASLPIIASDTGGTSEITGSENGRLFQYQNAIQLEETIESLLTNPESIPKKGKVSRQIIEERFTVEKMIFNYISILEKILGAPIQIKSGE